MLRLICLIVLFLSVLNIGLGQTKTYIDGSNSPYIIQNTLTVNNGDTLILGPGAIIKLADSVDIVVYGNFKAVGTTENPVRIEPIGEIGWGQIKVQESSDSLVITNAEIFNGRLWVNSNHVQLKNIHFTNNQNLEWNGAIGRFYFGSLTIDSCSISGINKGEGFLVHSVDNATVTNCSFMSIPDAVEFLNCDYGRIGKSEFRNIRDDAIDLNHCYATLVDSNFIIGVTDRGMEIGSENNGSSVAIRVERNIIANCFEGINFKGGSTGTVAHNTLYNNTTAITSIAFDTPNLPSSVDVSNTIFNSNTQDFITEESSTVAFNYCLSDNMLIEGQHNLRSDPFFTSVSNEDFSLLPVSPCIDAGNGSDPTDPDGTVADIGAIFQVERPNEKTLLWPNPCEQFIFVTSYKRIHSIDITNVLGQNIFSQNVNGDFHIMIDTNQFPSGYYTLTINSPENPIIKQFLKH